MSGTFATPEGITNPPIDELLEATDSKYSLVIYAAKRARQINAYYSQLGEGLLEYVGPLVDTHLHLRSRCRSPCARSTPELLTAEPLEPDGQLAGSRRARRPAEHCALGVAGGIAAYKACELLRRFTEGGATVTVVPTASALKFVGAATWEALSGKPVTSEVFESVHEVPRTSASASGPIWWWWHPPPRT